MNLRLGFAVYRNYPQLGPPLRLPFYLDESIRPTHELQRLFS